MDIKMLVTTLPGEVNLAWWCRRLGISRQTAYKWRRRYQAEGVAGLEDRSRAPRRPAGRSPAELEEAVVAIRKRLVGEGLDAGAASLRWHVAQAGLAAPSEATVWRILTRRGQIVPQPAKRPRRSYRRFQRSRPNECWQGDDTHYLLGDSQEVRIINMIDDHSRLNVASLAVSLCPSERIWECFGRASERWGPPAEFLNDNGKAWRSADGEHPVVFQAHLAAAGVHQLHSSVRHPQTCGKVERFHQTQRRWLDAHPPAATVAELQALLDRFSEVYNHARPHRALGRRTPAEVWAAQPPATPGAPAGEAVRICTSRADRSGSFNQGSTLSIYLGVAWAHRQLTVIRRGAEFTIIATTTGEIIRQLTIDPTRRCQPLGQRRRRQGPNR